MASSSAAGFTHDVVIVGGGHNALVAAAYLASAGRSVIVLERLGHLGGAAVSARPWEGVDANLSRYSYLVSLLPRRIIDDLGLRIELRRRRYSSYTPDPADPARVGPWTSMVRIPVAGPVSELLRAAVEGPAPRISEQPGVFGRRHGDARRAVADLDHPFTPGGETAGRN